MGDLSDVAREILSATRVVTDAAGASPGKPVNVAVLPGFGPQAPTNFNLSGTLGGTVGGAISGVLSAVVNAVSIQVKYTITSNAGHPPKFVAVPPLDNATDFSALNPLNVAFLFEPPLSDDTVLGTPITYTIQVDVSVNVEGNKVKTGDPGAILPIKVSVVMPALGIPALFLLSKHANLKAFDGDDPGQLLVMVRASSPLRDLGTVIGTWNALMNTLSTLQSVLGWAAAFGDVTKALGLVVTAVNTIPTVFLSVGNANDFGDFGDLEGKGSSALLIGVTGTQVTLFNDEDFSQGGLNDENSLFTATDIGAPKGIATGIGIANLPTFGNWDTDAGESMDDAAESAMFGSIS
jgi:hypothetical protein